MASLSKCSWRGLLNALEMIERRRSGQHEDVEENN